VPCYNHADTLAEVVGHIRSTCKDASVIVVDDGSNPPIKISAENAELLRLDKNSGKACALKLGFSRARERGFTHVITMDADSQHPVSKIPEFIGASTTNSESIIIGVRDFENSAIPAGRKFMNKFSNFWFRAETGIALADTQCGFRCYPLDKIEMLNLSFGGFVFEVELLVKAAWAGIDISEIGIPAVYDAKSLKNSHYKPFSDTMKFTMMNTRLFFTRLFCSANFRKKISLKK